MVLQVRKTISSPWKVNRAFQERRKCYLDYALIKGRFIPDGSRPHNLVLIFVLMFHLRHDPSPIYQWVPPIEPQVLCKKQRSRESRTRICKGPLPDPEPPLRRPREPGLPRHHRPPLLPARPASRRTDHGTLGPLLVQGLLKLPGRVQVQGAANLRLEGDEYYSITPTSKRIFS